NGASWNFQVLDGAGDLAGTRGAVDGDVGKHTAVTIYNNQPHVFYRDDAAGLHALRHGWWDGAAWNFQVLDGAGNVGTYSAVTIYNGQPHVFYFDDTANNLRHGFWTGTEWQFETLDGNAHLGTDGRTDDIVGEYNAVVIYNGQPHDFYYDRGVNLT